MAILSAPSTGTLVYRRSPIARTLVYRRWRLEGADRRRARELPVYRDVARLPLRFRDPPAALISPRGAVAGRRRRTAGARAHAPSPLARGAR